MSITRTYNPIHFEDLEPHRFEDLIRQLVYDFKDWKSIEATGRLGSDDGIDILAIENYFNGSIDDEENVVFDERIWIIQCKREKNSSPKKVLEILQNDIGKQETIPYGYILASSSNFSKKSRDIFKLTLNQLGVKEFYIYGKAEIEDLLYQPKYDHLLFAYFGVSLQKRKQSIKSNLSARLTTKRKLVKLLGNIGEIEYKTIFVRPSESIEYPKIKDENQLEWRFYETMVYQPADCIAVIAKKHLAYIDWEKKEWDIIDDHDIAFKRHPHIWGMSDDFYEKQQLSLESVYQKWGTIEEQNQAFYIELRAIHFDRIALIDEIGDSYNEAPHLFVDYINNSPFVQNKNYIAIRGMGNKKFLNDPDVKNRIKIFEK